MIFQSPAKGGLHQVVFAVRVKAASLEIFVVVVEDRVVAMAQVGNNSDVLRALMCRLNHKEDPFSKNFREIAPIQNYFFRNKLEWKPETNLGHLPIKETGFG